MSSGDNPEDNYIEGEKKKIEQIKKDVANNKFVLDDDNDELIQFLKQGDLSYSNLAHLYFLFSNKINNILSKYYKKEIFTSTKSLREAYKELIIIENCINYRKANPKTRIVNENEDSRESIWYNKSYCMDILNHYITVMQNVDNNKYMIYAFIVSVISIGISIFTLLKELGFI